MLLASNVIVAAATILAFAAFWPLIRSLFTPVVPPPSLVIPAPMQESSFFDHPDSVRVVPLAISGLLTIVWVVLLIVMYMPHHR